MTTSYHSYHIAKYQLCKILQAFTTLKTQLEALCRTGIKPVPYINLRTLYYSAAVKASIPAAYLSSPAYTAPSTSPSSVTPDTTYLTLN